jgi:hypothetical protein
MLTVQRDISIDIPPIPGEFRAMIAATGALATVNRALRGRESIESTR